MPFLSGVSPDRFIFIPNVLSGSTPASSIKDPPILFFITGNPGLVAYYYAFLSSLAQSLSADRTRELGFDTSQCVIASFSLGGFEVEKQTSYHNLQDQIRLTSSRIRDLVATLIHEYPNSWTRPPQVILLGHSVGAFIALEVVRDWHQTRPAHGPDPALEATHTPLDATYEFPGVILLTPTIIDIARSSLGRIATPLLTYVPGLPRFLQAVAKGLCWALPNKALRWVVARVTGMEDPGLSTTVTLLSGRSLVQQSLRLASDEMREITADRWGDEIWSTVADATGVDNSGRSRNAFRRVKAPKLVFYFAAKDHWVADATREEILRTRGRVGGERIPTMVVEEQGKLVHGWCISQSGHVAAKVRGWVDEILTETR